MDSVKQQIYIWSNAFSSRAEFSFRIGNGIACRNHLQLYSNYGSTDDTTPQQQKWRDARNLVDLARRRHHRRAHGRQRVFERLELGMLGDVEHADDRRLRAAQVNRLRVISAKQVPNRKRDAGTKSVLHR